MNIPTQHQVFVGSSFCKRQLASPVQKSSKMAQLLASPPKNSSPVTPGNYVNKSLIQEQACAPKSNITFNCPKPSRQALFSKSAAYHHTPPPACLANHNFMDEEEDDDDDDDDSVFDDSEYDLSDDDEDDDDDNVYNTHSKLNLTLCPNDDIEGVFLSD